MTSVESSDFPEDLEVEDLEDHPSADDHGVSAEADSPKEHGREFGDVIGFEGANKWTILSYFYGTLATGIKTFAWWFNQWPEINHYNFFLKWIISAGIAGCEYAPLTMAMQTANNHMVHLGLMTAYMEAADNFLRMMQQLGLGDPLAWFDWLAAFALAACVGWQGWMHWKSDHGPVSQQEVARKHAVEMQKKHLVGGSIGDSSNVDSPRQDSAVQPVDHEQDEPGHFFTNFTPLKKIVIFFSSIFIVVGSLVGGLAGGYTGQAYVCATLATGAKTFAWWINQYPALKHMSFYQKWLAGWSIAAFIEYLPLMGAFTIAHDHGVHLGLMTAYMEALDNFFRICQQRLLNKRLSWYDLVAAAGMFVAVIFQGVMRYAYDHGDV